MNRTKYHPIKRNSLPIYGSLYKMDHANECSICYENFADQDLELGEASDKERLEVEGCGHAFCRECLADHCKHSISAREVPIRCPAFGSENCRIILPEHQVENFLGAREGMDGKECGRLQYGSINEALSTSQEENKSVFSHWTQFQRLIQKLGDPTLVSCTRCDELVSPEQNGLFQTHPNDISCPSCSHKFCAVHGDAHLQQSCADYKPGRHDAKSEIAIRRSTKPCSHCGIPIHKESGCDHIVCISCKKDMCFRCGSHEFLSGEMVRSCSKCEQNYIDHRYIWRYRMTLCLSLPIYLPICILYVVVMASLAIATCGCCCCLGCGLKGVLVDDEEVPTKVREKIIFRPVEGIRTVLGMILFPVIDLFNQCGFPCCLQIPGVHTTETDTDSVGKDVSAYDSVVEK